MKPQIIVPADIYDTMEFACEVYKGIGSDTLYTGGTRPNCQLGYREFINGDLDDGKYDPLHFPGIQGYLIDTYGHGRLSTDVNDDAVRAINARKGASPNARVSWAEYCEELNIVRGE